MGGPDGKIFGSRSGRTDLAALGPYVLTESQIFSRPARDLTQSISIFCSSLNRTRLHKIRRLRALNNYSFSFFASNKKLTIHRKTKFMFSFLFMLKSQQKVDIKLSKICQAIKNLASDKRSLHASLKLFTNLHLKTHENVGIVSSYLSTSWIL